MPKIKQTEPLESESRSSASEPSAKQSPVRRVSRSQINPAKYNPRTISDYGRKQLADSLKKFGLVEPLVWNETTGNLCGGHQRLSILDKQMGFPGVDYTLEVSVVTLPLRKEKELNVWLNNRAAQGQFDQDLFLEFMAGEHGMKLEDLGINAIDLDFDFGGAGAFEDLLAREKKESDPIKRDVDAIKKRNKEARSNDNAEPEQDADYFVMVCFGSGTEKEAWLKEHKFPPMSRVLSQVEYEAAIRTA